MHYLKILPKISKVIISRGLLTGSVTSLLLKTLQQHFIDVTLFSISNSVYSRSVMFKRTNNFAYVLPDVYEFMRPNSRHTSAFFPHLFICHITLTFPSMLEIFLVIVTAAMLSRYQPAVNWSTEDQQTRC